jgi:hypothetical protein
LAPQFQLAFVDLLPVVAPPQVLESPALRSDALLYFARPLRIPNNVPHVLSLVDMSSVG